MKITIDNKKKLDYAKMICMGIIPPCIYGGFFVLMIIIISFTDYFIVDIPNNARLFSILVSLLFILFIYFLWRRFKDKTNFFVMLLFGLVPTYIWVIFFNILPGLLSGKYLGSRSFFTINPSRIENLEFRLVDHVDNLHVPSTLDFFISVIIFTSIVIISAYYLKKKYDDKYLIVTATTLLFFSILYIIPIFWYPYCPYILGSYVPLLLPFFIITTYLVIRYGTKKIYKLISISSLVSFIGIVFCFSYYNDLPLIFPPIKFVFSYGFWYDSPSYTYISLLYDLIRIDVSLSKDVIFILNWIINFIYWIFLSYLLLFVYCRYYKVLKKNLFNAHWLRVRLKISKKYFGIATILSAILSFVLFVIFDLNTYQGDPAIKFLHMIRGEDLGRSVPYWQLVLISIICFVVLTFVFYFVINYFQKES